MNKKLKKIVGAVLLAVAIAITQIPASPVDAASDFQLDKDVLVKYSGTANVVSVPDGVKEIGEEAFLDCNGITSIQLPKSLKKINYGAFRNCRGLKTVIVPEACEEICSQAFADCVNLSEFSIPASLKEMGSGVFAGDKKLASVKIASQNSNFMMKDGVLYNEDMSKLITMFAGRKDKKFVMPSSVETIEKYAFWGCGNLESMVISNYVTEIPAYAFSYCRGLKTVQIPYSVNRIDTKAFEYCPNLTDTVIPDSVSYIHPTAFDGCASLNIIADEGSVAEEYFKNFDKSQSAVIDYEDNEDYSIDLTKKVSSVSHNSSDVSDVSDVIALESYSEAVDAANVIGRTRVVGQQAVVFIDNSRVEIMEGDTLPNYPYTDEMESVSDNSTQNSDGVAPKYTIVGDTIADKAFYGKEELLTFTFPDGIKRIGDFSFARSGLTQISIPQGVKSIGYGAFYHCDQLSVVQIPTSVTDIEPAAFYKTPWFNNWYYGGNVDEYLVVGDGVLIGYKGNSSVAHIPSNVHKIGAEVFKDHTELQAVYIPDGVTEIGEDAFSGCTNLKQISGGTYNTKIADRAFFGCPIETVRIPATMEEIGLLSFGGENDNQTVVFQGNELPKLSYEKTSTRLGNEAYRDLAFQAKTAIVDDEVEEFQYTILDENILGFRGIVCSITSEPTDTQYGTVKLKYCTLEADEITGNVVIPNQISIFGQEYKITSVSRDAFLPYETYSEWATNKPTDIVIDGGITQGKNVTENLELAAEAGINKRTVSENSAYIIIEDEKPVIKDGKIFQAEFQNLKKDFHLRISDEDESVAKLKEAVEKAYGPISNGQLWLADFELFDASNNIPITKLGKEYLTLTMSIPPGMEDDTLCAVSIDQNGQLETGFVTYTVVNEQKCIQFDISHFSPYGIYCATGELADTINAKISNPSNEGNKDISPDTGDYLDPKWILAAGFTFLALLLLLSKTKPKKQ